MHTLFDDIPQEILQRIQSQSRDFLLKSGHVLHMKYDNRTYLYIVKSGYVTLRYPSRMLPTDTYFLAWRGPDSVLGEVEILTSRERDPIIKATEDCHLLEMPTDMFVSEAQSCPTLYKNLARALNHKVMEHGKRMEVVQIPRANKRVARTLFILAKDRGYRENSKDCIKGKITNEDLCGYTALSDGSVKTALRELADQGLIKRITANKEGIVQIMDLDALERFTLPES